MNWDAIGAVGQVLGSGAVLVTLVYLAIQTNHARMESRRIVNESRRESLIRQFHWLATDSRLRDAGTKAHHALAGDGGLATPAFVTTLMERGLTEDDAWALFYFQSAQFVERSQAIATIDLLSPGQRASFDGAIRLFYGRSGVARLFYDTMKAASYSPEAEAIRYIDEVLARPG